VSTDDDFTAYVGTHWSSLVRCALLLRGTDRAEAIVEDALVDAYQHWARVWREDRPQAEVLARLLDAIYTPLGRTWRGEQPDTGPSTLADDEQDSDLARALRPLTPVHRDVLVLTYVGELDDQQAAEVLRVAAPTVQARLEAALLAAGAGTGRGPDGLTAEALVDLVEQHRQEQLMSLPPPALLATARQTRGRRRRRTTVLTGGVLAALVLVSGTVQTVRGIGRDPAPAAPPASRPVVIEPAPTTRLVGLNGWTVQVPAEWGTDLGTCDRSTFARPTVTFTSLLPAGARCPTGSPYLYLRIGDESFPGVPWRTISGVPVVRRRHACLLCATLRVPSAGVSFDIRANSGTELHRIERSLQPIGDRQVTVPLPTGPTGQRSALDQMVTVSTGIGLRPRTLEVPSRQAPGTFLRSDPPIGTPVDLGRAIALYFSAGDLSRFATGRSLARHGWRIFPVSNAETTYGRVEARRAAGVSAGTPSRHPAFLRTVTITHEGPRRVVVRRRLAWLVVTPAVGRSRPGASSIVVVDATTDHVIETQQGFGGLARAAIR
jgi:DNA-directed RNA polymerase specialized sigma24 family protein